MHINAASVSTFRSSHSEEAGRASTDDLRSLARTADQIRGLRSEILSYRDVRRATRFPRADHRESAELSTWVHQGR